MPAILCIYTLGIYCLNGGARGVGYDGAAPCASRSNLTALPSDPGSDDKNQHDHRSTCTSFPLAKTRNA
uniref:Putative secreted protein n=1 Tax=Anopheles darlingi TaxID=43151 RepID=A0A2M4DPY8_ANODA